LEPAIATIIIGAVQILASALTPLVVERLGRKVIFLFSAGGMAICLGLLGLFFLLDEQEFPIASSLNWLPIVSLIGFVVVYCVGFGPLPWALFGELFAPDVKSSASSIVTSMNWTLGFLLTKYFLALQEVLGSYGAFWLFGIFCIAAFIFTFTLVFETKGLSLQQIQDKLNGR
jgi:MFS family permease